VEATDVDLSELTEYDPDESIDSIYTDIQIVPSFRCNEVPTAAETDRAMLKIRKRAWQKSWQPNELEENWELMEKGAAYLSAETRAVLINYDGRSNAGKQQEEYSKAIQSFYSKLDPSNTIADKPLRPLHQVIQFCRAHFPGADCAPLLPGIAGADALPADGRSLEDALVQFVRLSSTGADSQERDAATERRSGGEIGSRRMSFPFIGAGAVDAALGPKANHAQEREQHVANLQHGLVCLSDEVLPQAPRSWKEEQNDEPIPLHFNVEMSSQQTSEKDGADGVAAVAGTTPARERPNHVAAKEEMILPNLTDYAAKIRQYLPEALQTDSEMSFVLDNQGLLGFLQPINELCEMGAAAPVRRFVALAGEVAAYNDTFRSRGLNVQEQMRSAYTVDHSAIRQYAEQAGQARREMQDAMVARGAVVELSSADVKGFFDEGSPEVKKPRRRDSLKLPDNPMGMSPRSEDEEEEGAGGAGAVSPNVAAQMITWQPMHGLINKAETQAEQAEDKYFKLLRMWAVQTTALLDLLQSVLSFVLDTSLREHELWPGAHSDTHAASVKKLTSALWYVSGVLERISTLAMMPLEMGDAINSDMGTARARAESENSEGGAEAEHEGGASEPATPPKPPPKPVSFSPTDSPNPVVMGVPLSSVRLPVVQGTVVQAVVATNVGAGGPVGVKVDEGPLGIGVRINRLTDVTSDYPLRFDYYTDTPEGNRTKELSGGKFTTDMVLTHVNGESVKGIHYTDAKAKMAVRPIAIVFQGPESLSSGTAQLQMQQPSPQSKPVGTLMEWIDDMQHGDLLASSTATRAASTPPKPGMVAGWRRGGKQKQLKLQRPHSRKKRTRRTSLDGSGSCASYSEAMTSLGTLEQIMDGRSNWMVKSMHYIVYSHAR
jgi:hypothetical protein